MLDVRYRCAPAHLLAKASSLRHGVTGWPGKQGGGLDAVMPSEMEILLGSGGTRLTIAQRFNAGHYAFVFVLSPIGDDRDFLSSLAGLDHHFIIKPSVKTLGYCQFSDRNLTKWL